MRRGAARALLLGLASSLAATAARPPSHVRIDPAATRSVPRVAAPLLAGLDPGDSVWDLPPVSLDLLEGGSVDLASLAPATFNVLDSDQLFSTVLWEWEASLQGLLTRQGASTGETRFVFASNANSTAAAAADVATLRSRFADQLLALNFSAARCDAFWARAVFVTTPVSQMDWVVDLLQSWPTTTDGLEVHVGSTTTLLPVLNARWDWVGWTHHPSNHAGRQPAPLVDVMEQSGDAVLVLDGPLASPEQTMRQAAAHGARAVVVVAPLGAVAVPLGPSAEDAEPLLPLEQQREEEEQGEDKEHHQQAIPVVHVTFATGQELRRWSRQGSATALFATTAVPGTDFAVDAAGRLQQSWGGSGLGNTNDTTYGNPGDPSAKHTPSMAYLAYAAQHLAFRHALDEQLAEQHASMAVVSVFNGTAIQNTAGHCYGNTSTMYNCGPWAVVALPQKWELSSQLVLDFALGCNTTRDISCPQWDHIVTAQVCALNGADSCDSQNDGVEFGRWITTFSRGIGRWATDVTPLLPLFGGRESGSDASLVNITIMTVPWSGNQGQIPWTATLSLLFSKEPAAQAPVAVSVPWYAAGEASWARDGNGVYTYFRWIPFNQSYADWFTTPLPVVIPQTSSPLTQALLVAVISGHGNDNNGCGEFCGTRHAFAANGRPPHVVHHLLPALRAQHGCADGVPVGTTPNEYGTWLYGRDGWCNGREVGPRVLNLTADLNLSPGATNELTYEGLWCDAPGNCSAPDPTSQSQGSPVMMMRAYLVLFTSAAASASPK